MNTEFMSKTTESLHLEPRVARLETGLETLTRNVGELAESMREGSTSTNQKIDALVVAVTQAQAPKKTDWSLFISIGFFILALGSAVFYPLNKATIDNKEELKAVHSLFVEHQKLELHPVGAAKIDVLLQDLAGTKLELIKRDESLDQKIQKETQLMTDLLSARLDALDKRLQVELGLKIDIAKAELNSTISRQSIINEKIYQRMDKLEEANKSFSDKERDELRQWRSKAMGLSTPDLVIPLVKRSDSIDIKK